MNPTITLNPDRLAPQFQALWKMPTPTTGLEADETSIKDLKAGSYLELDRKTYQVKARHRYTEGGSWEWYELELFCLETGETKYLEWEEDDGIELCLTLEAGISLTKLGVSAQTRKDIKKLSSIVVGNKTYYYEDDCQAKFFRNETGDGENVTMIEFEGPNDYLLSFEEWTSEAGSEWEAHLCQMIETHRVKILSV